ncbi:11561_t:CDS:2, partial [Gigaspora margarita]
MLSERGISFRRLSSYSDTLSWPNKDKLNESNELNDLNSSNISKNVHDLDVESGSSSHDQSLSHNSRVTVTNSLGKRVRKKDFHLFQRTESERKLVTDKDGLEKECSNKYELSTGTSNLKAHLYKTKLSDLLLSIDKWNSVDELAKLLYPFMQATGYIGGSQYLILEIIIPTLIKLSRYLKEFYSTITSQTVKAYCSKINQSMLSRWSEPLSHSLIAAFLDLRFKQMNYIMANYVIPNKTENVSLIEKEVTLYDSLLQIPKYHIMDEEYPRKYLTFSATSVPSERVFSSAGNTIMNKRNQLNPDTVYDLLFLKKNSKIFTVYPDLDRKFCWFH